MMTGVKIWVLKQENNYKEFWYFPMFELNQNTRDIIVDYDYPEILVSRNIGDASVLIYYTDKDGIMLTDYKPMSEVYTMKSRKVSYEERIEIVNYCIANNYDYKGTADKYNIPYSQVYTWVKKVKENGYESLKLQKKGPKPKYLVEPQTNEELLQLEIERLRREKERLELEVEVLKKKHRLQKRANIRK